MKESNKIISQKIQKSQKTMKKNQQKIMKQPLNNQQNQKQKKHKQEQLPQLKTQNQVIQNKKQKNQKKMQQNLSKRQAQNKQVAEQLKGQKQVKSTKNPIQKIKVSIGIPAYNEEANIENLLQSLKQQRLKTVAISEIIVIASGCTDNTIPLIKKYQKQWPIVKLIIEKERNGKSSAVNKFIATAEEQICVLQSADTICDKNTIEELCSPFNDKKTGMTGAHPIPTNKKNNFINFTVKQMWDMHHEIALKEPKCGELIAFRKIFQTIPANSPVDEASIEKAIIKKNLNIIYVPTAIVYNKGPETIKEFISQRRRIAAGHIWLKKNHNHKISTGKNSSVLKLTLKKFSPNLKKDTWLIGMMSLEALSRILGHIDYHFNPNKHKIWKKIKSTKNPEINNNDNKK